MDFRLRDMRYFAGEVHARHAHDEVQISIVLCGTMTEDVNGVAYRGRAGDVIVKPAGVMHSDEFDGSRIVCLDADPRGIDVPLGAYSWHRTAASSAAAMRVVRSFVNGADVAEDVDELLAALPARAMVDRTLAVRAARTLDDAFATPLRLQDLAADLGVHRVYLARVFRAQWGCTPREYMQQLRVRAAAHGLASTATPLAEVALDSGFSDQAHMSRMFARTMGVTPAAFRRMARG